MNPVEQLKLYIPKFLTQKKTIILFFSLVMFFCAFFFFMSFILFSTLSSAF